MNKLIALAQHILAMADDAYLNEHPEWYSISSEASNALNAYENDKVYKENLWGDEDARQYAKYDRYSGSELRYRDDGGTDGG